MGPSPLKKVFVGMVFIDHTVFGIVVVALIHLNPSTGGLMLELSRLIFAGIMTLKLSIPLIYSKWRLHAFGLVLLKIP